MHEYPREYSRGSEFDDKSHHPSCRIPANVIAKRDGKEVGPQRNFEPDVLMACGTKILRCCVQVHWDLCFERKGLCFYPAIRAESAQG